MLVELCASNYATFDSLVNEIDGIFKISIRYCEKIIIWITFQFLKLEHKQEKNIINITTTTMNKIKHQLNLSSKI